jgi:large subunit ribosomal protein L10
MTKDQKNEAIEVLKEKFNQYNNFYITNTQALSVAQINKLRKICFDKKVEMKVAKNTLIKKALEGIDSAKYAGVFDSLSGVTALLFSEDAKEPALIISSFRTNTKTEKPVLKAAFIDTDVFVGNDQLEALKTLKSKNELIGEIIGLLQSPAKNVISGLNAGSKLASLLKALEDRQPQEVEA